jgi:hypothetical protein
VLLSLGEATQPDKVERLLVRLRTFDPRQVAAAITRPKAPAPAAPVPGDVNAASREEWLASLTARDCIVLADQKDRHKLHAEGGGFKGRYVNIMLPHTNSTSE